MTGPQLRARRRALELTQSQLAGELEVSRETINRWETGALPVPRLAELALDALATAAETPA